MEAFALTPDELKALVRNIPDFPKPGIQFKDITPLLSHPRGFRRSIELLSDLYERHDYDIIAAPEARGFIFGCALAQQTGAGFVPIRKPGKLPYQTARIEYELEYGTDSVEVHSDAVEAGMRVLLVDDVLATGGTMRACTQLVEKLGGEVSGCLFLMEIQALSGREKLGDYSIQSLLPE